MSTLSWKLVPFVALVALGVFALSPGASTPQADAAVTGVTIDATSFISGGEVEVTVNLTANSGTVNITASGGASGESLTIVDCNPNCTALEGTSDNSWALTQNDLTQVVLTLTATCDAEETVTVSASQEGDGQAMTDTVTCQPFDPNVTIVKEANGATIDFDFTITGTSTECDQSFALADNESQGYACDEPGTYTVTEAGETGWTLSTLTCTDSGVPDGDISIDVATRRVTFTLGTNDTIECTFTNVPSASPTPTATATPAGASGVTVSAAPSTVNCSGSSFITVVVKSGSVNVADGTVVTVSTTSGSLSPTSAPTSGGGILTIFTAGSTSGTATITASAGGVTGTTTVTVNCGAPTAVPTSPPPPPPPVQPTVAPAGGIRPPNTGDAGLIDNGGTNWLIVIAGAVIATSTAGGLVLARRRF